MRAGNVATSERTITLCCCLFKRDSRAAMKGFDFQRLKGCEVGWASQLAIRWEAER